MGIFLLLTPIYQCRLRGGKQRKGQECGAQRLSGKYEDKRKNWLWIRESIINVDRKEPQYWYLTPGKKASKVQKEHSQGRGWTFFIKLNQLPDCSYNTNGLLVRLYSSDLLRFVLCLQQNYGISTFREEECVTCWCRSKHHCIGLSLWALYLPHIIQDHLHFNPLL